MWITSHDFPKTDYPIHEHMNDIRVDLWMERGVDFQHSSELDDFDPICELKITVVANDPGCPPRSLITEPGWVRSYNALRVPDFDGSIDSVCYGFHLVDEAGCGPNFRERAKYLTFKFQFKIRQNDYEVIGTLDHSQLISAAKPIKGMRSGRHGKPRPGVVAENHNQS